MFNMHKIQDYSEIRDRISTLKGRVGTMVTNYFPNPSLHKKWIAESRLFVEDFPRCNIFIKKNDGFSELFYIAGNEAADLKPVIDFANRHQTTAVIEVVANANKDGLDLMPLGFAPTCRLIRMTHSGILTTYENSDVPEIIKANEADIPLLLDIFSKYFNALTERIPDFMELQGLMKSDGIWLRKNKDGQCIGFIIFEHQGVNLHLRYWWTLPSYRGDGVGSSLFRAYIKASATTKRQFLWVFDDNENAICRYRHYGFETDGMTDNIYVVKPIKS